MNADPIDTTTAVTPRNLQRISWAAVFAGVLAVLVTQLLLSVLGIGIGASTIDPMSEQRPAAGIGIGAGIWFVVSAIIAFAVGGWMAGRLAGIPRRLDSLLHGVLAWALAVLIMFYLFTTAAGSLISGAAGALGRGVSLAAQGVAEIAPEAAQAVAERIDMSAIEQDARRIFQQLDSQDAQAAVAELIRLIGQIATRGDATIQPQDRDVLVNFLVTRANMPRAEAENTVTRWNQQYQQLRAEWQETRGELAQGAREVGEAAASGVAQAALWTFAIFLLAGGAAAAAGWMAAPKVVLETRAGFAAT